MDLKGKCALITGGGSGIGFATARLFGESGARVFIAGRRRGILDKARATLRKSGVDASAIVCEVSLSHSVESMAQELRARTEKVHFLVNSAGFYTKAPVWEMGEGAWDQTFDVNVKAIYLLTKSLLPMMRGVSGAIVNIASTLAYQTSPSTSAYAASKAAVVSLTRSMARELGGMGIRVNCVCPGVVDTPIHDREFDSAGAKEEFLRRLGEQLPLGRVGRPEDIAHAVLFLVSDRASWITGAVLAVDGGISII